MTARTEWERGWSCRKQGRYRTALELFKDPAFEGTYDTACYLYPLAILHAGDKDKGREAIDECLTRPRIAKYLLDPGLPPPEPDSAPFFGITGGSELEGYIRAAEFRELWEACPGALQILRQSATEAEAQGWPAFLKRTS